MAVDLGKMWFEMGIRDNVTNSLGKILEMTKILQGDMNKVVASATVLGKIKPVKFDNGKAVRDALNYQKMLLRIDDALERISNRRLSATVDTDKLDHATKQLLDFRNQLEKLQSLNGNDWNGDMLTTQNTALRNVLQVVNSLLREQQNAERNVAAQTQANAKANMDLVASYDKIVEKGSAATRAVGQLTNQIGTYVSIYGAERLLKSIIEVGGEFEVQHIALQSILGDLEQANTMFNQIKQLAVVSPFNFKELVTYSKQVAAFNVPYAEMYDTTRRLADMSAGLGVDMGRLILAFGQVRSAAVLRGQELRQFTEAGIPMVQALADEFTKLNGKVVTTGEVFDLISKRAVPFEMVKKVLWDMTNEGGRFYNMQFTLADTLTGKWSNLVDAWQIMLSEFAKGESITGKMFKGMVQGLTWLIENIDNLTPVIATTFAALSMAKVVSFMSKLATFGNEYYSATIAKAQQLNAIKIRERFIQGEINKSEMISLLNRNKDATLWRTNLILAGRMNKMALIRLDYTKLENRQLLMQMMRIGQIDAVTRRLILNGRGVAAAFRMVSMSMTTALSSAGLLSLGLQAAVAALAWFATDWLMNSNKMNEAYSASLESMKQRYDELFSFVKNNPIDIVISTGNEREIKEMIDRYKDAIKEAIPDEAASIIGGAIRLSAGSLEKELLSLKEQVDLLQRAQHAAKEMAGAFDEAEESTNRWNTEGIADNMQDFQDAINDYIKQTKNWNYSDYDELANRLIAIEKEATNSGRALSKYETNLVEIGRTVKQMLSSGNTFEAISRYIGLQNAANTPAANDRKFDFGGVFDMSGGIFTNSYAQQKENFDRQLTEIYNDIKERMIQKGQDLSTEVGRRTFQMLSTEWMGRKEFSKDMQSYAQLFWDSIMNSEFQVKSDNLPRIIAEYMKTIDKDGVLSKYITGEDTSDKVVDSVRSMFEIAKTEITARYPEFKKIIDNTFNYSPLILPVTVTESLGGAFKILTGWRKEVNDYMKDHGINIPISADMSMEDLKKKVTEYKDELQTSVDESGKILIGMGFKLDALPSENALSPLSPYFKEQGYDRYTTSKPLLDAVNELIKHFSLNVETKHDKKNNGTKKDSALERAKTRLEELKSFLDEYRKFEAQYGREKAIDLVEKFFPGLKGKGASIVDNYLGELEKIKNSLSLNTEARKKFGTSIDKLEAEYTLKFDKDSADKAVKEMQEYIEKGSKQWNLYKILLEKSGDENLAKLAFKDGAVWDEQAEALAKKLRSILPDNMQAIDWGMTDAEAKEHFKGINGAYDLWKKIVSLITNNYTDGLQKTADATSKLLSITEKIAKLEREISDLRKKGASENDPRIIQKQEEIKKLAVEQFETSEPYLKFYSAILAMTAEEAENAGIFIKENLVKQLADGVINADKYLKSIKNVESQLAKIRGNKGAFMTFATGGLTGLQSRKYDKQDAEVAANAIKIQLAQEKLLEARKAQAELDSKASDEQILAAKIRLALAKSELEILEKNQKNAQALLKSIGIKTEDLKSIATVMSNVSSAFDGLQQGAQQISNMFDALGMDGRAAGWGDAADFIGAIGGGVKSATNVLKSAMNGDVGGIISNTVGIITGPITGLAQLHDKKLDRAIQKSQREVRRLGYEYKNIQDAMEKALGGIYSTGGYREMLANLKKQRDEIQKQRNAEDRKKKTDADKLMDYDQQLKEMDEQIKNFALDMANTLYSIDLSNWASRLTEAIVGAWERGEDAAKAFRDTVKEIVGDITKNILTKKVLEAAFDQLGIDDLIKNEMVMKNGKLDPTSITKIADALNQAGEMTVIAITDILDELERKGYVEKGGGSSSSITASAKSLTEETGDLVASYLNAIRLDVSATRATIMELLKVAQGQDEMPVIARAQLAQLEAIANYTRRNADAAERIYNILHSVAPDGQRINIA